MNNSLQEWSQKKGIIIPLDFHSNRSSSYLLCNKISAELHTPIVMIQSNIQLLRKFCYNSDDFIVTETFQLCEDSIESIIGFIERVDFVSISDNSQVKLKPEWFSLSLSISQIFAEIGHLNHDISRIGFSNSVGNHNIHQDKYLFIRILVNLLSNALKYSTGEVELNIATTGDEISIVVRDFGIGIPENQILNIFKPFVRGTNVSKIKGSGLGLSIVANALKCINGNITLQSKVGKGTEFIIRFPFLKGNTDLIQPSQKYKSFYYFDTCNSEYCQIIGTISHELRTPFAILKSNIQLLKDLTSGNNNLLINESIHRCDTSLMDIQHFFDRLSLLNTTIRSVANLSLSDLELNKWQVN